MLNKRNWWNVGVVAAALALVALFAVAPAGAQEQVGAITGTVTDASGAVLPGATVEAVSAGGTRLSGTTNESGAYRFPRVPPGTYVVVAKLDGFNPAEVQGVAVRLGDTVTANITLEVGAISETISVVGEAGQVDVKSSATSATRSARSRSSLLPKAVTSPASPRWPRAPPTKASSAASRSTALPVPRTASSSTVSTPPTRRTASPART